jgi:uncharacterized membrane protein
MRYVSLIGASLLLLSISCVQRKYGEGANVKTGGPSVSTNGKNFVCSGTEPFWSMAIKDRDVTLTDPESKTQYKIGVIKTPAGAGEGYVSVFMLHREAGSEADVVIRREQKGCSDGMSDTVYTHSVVFAGDVVLAGCCSLK